MNVGIIGAGCVGLVSAVCLAELGCRVYAAEKDPHKLAAFQSGNSTLFEKDLDMLLLKNYKSGRLNFFPEAREVVNQCKIILLCVGTPPRADGSADMSQVKAAMGEIVSAVYDKPEYRLVLIKSTVPIGTTDWLSKAARLYAKGKELPLEVAFSPEFLREGSAVHDFLYPDRIVLGVVSERAKELLQDLYQGFECPLMFTDPTTAEIIKYASNCFLATRISFINMIADICENVGADVSAVARGMGLDPRIGPHYLQAGIGFGGSCLPKDLRAFLHFGTAHSIKTDLLNQVMEINKNRSARVVERIKDHLWTIRGKRIAVLGLTFKANTDDVRETPAASLIKRLKEEGALVRANDPVGIDNFISMFPDAASDVEFFSDIEGVLRGSQAALIAAAWQDYIDLDWAWAKSIMVSPIVIDCCGILDDEKMYALGYDYVPVGRQVRYGRDH